jgi:uncharacterized RDD family membrane protein YckC/cytoskeletal protein CcmA (bactofilin family)
MKRKALSGKSIAALALGMLTLLSVPPLRAQDDAVVKKDEPAAVGQPIDLPTPAVDANDEGSGQTWRDGKDTVMVGNDFVLKEDEVAANVVVVSGNATIRGRVAKDLVVVAGSANVTGTVDGDMVTVLGSATLGPNAEVKRDVTVVGGTLTSEPTSKIGGTPTVVSTLGMFPDFEWLKAYAVHGLMLARPIAPQVRWVWAVAGICLLIYLLIALLFPRPIQACVEALEKRPVGSFFMGILLFVLFAPLTFLLAVSIVGIVVIPFLACAMVVAFLFGKVSVYRFAGTQLGKQFNLPTLQLPLIAFLIGALLFCLLYTIPVLGFLVWAAIIPFGMGAVVLAAFGGLRREGNGKVPVAPPSGGAAAVPVAPGLEPPLMQTPTTPADFISMARAGFWLRTFATITDILLFVFVVIVTGPKAVFLWFIYHIAMWAWKGTTVGGIVMGIKLVRVDGRPVDIGVALVRAAASIFSALIFGLGFFWAGWNREKQSWHDKIAGTVMVKVPKGVALL